MVQIDHPEILARLDRLDRRFDEVLDLLVAQRTVKAIGRS
jgi:tetrahydromethanopterin S-methyltransferase subunit G